MAICENPFLVRFVGFTTEPPFLIATEYMPNGSLNKMIRGKGKINLSGYQLTIIAMGIAYGMITIHSHNIIHRDLKCANILLDSNFYPKICDFGISRFENEIGEDLTKKIGTPNYMAPELFKPGEYDNKVDVYAYAMILYEMSERIRPFHGLKIEEIFKRVVRNNERPPFTDATPEPLQKLIKSCWSSNPQERPGFVEIFQLFKKKKIMFLSSEPSYIISFLKYIQDYEDNSLLGKTEEKIVQNSVFNEEETTQPETKINSEIEGNRKIIKIIRKKVKQPNKKLQKKPLTLITKCNIQSKERNEKLRTPNKEEIKLNPLEIALNEPNHPNFIHVFQMILPQLNPNNFKSFYEPVSCLISSSDTSINELQIIVTGCLNSMKDNNNLISSFYLANYFQSLILHLIKIPDLILSNFELLFCLSPQLINENIFNTLKLLNNKYPDKMLNMYSNYVKVFANLKNPWGVIDLLFSLKNILRDLTSGNLFLILCWNILQHEQLISSRSEEIKKVFIDFLHSINQSNVCLAYRCLIDFPPINSNLLSTFVTHLRSTECWHAVIDFLTQTHFIEEICPDQFFIEALCYRSLNPTDKYNSLAFFTLLKLTSSPNATEAMILYPYWMHLEPVQSFNIFLALFTNTELREKLSNIHELPILLSSICSIGQPKYLRGISLILHKIKLTHKIFLGLVKNGFIAALAEVCTQNQTIDFFSPMLLILDIIGRAGNAKDFEKFPPLLSQVLKIQSLRKNTIYIIALLSQYPQCALLFKNLCFEEYLQPFEEDSRLKHAVKHFTYNIRQVKNVN